MAVKEDSQHLYTTLYYRLSLLQVLGVFLTAAYMVVKGDSQYLYTRLYSVH